MSEFRSGLNTAESSLHRTLQELKEARSALKELTEANSKLNEQLIESRNQIEHLHGVKVS